MKSKYTRGKNPNSHKQTKKANLKRSKKLKGRTWTKEQNEKRKRTLLGHKHSEETIEKIKKKIKEVFPNGRPINSGNWKKGQTKGEKNVNWKGGKSFEEYGEEWTEELRHKIRVRDKGMCQLCLCRNRKLCVHHIDYNKKNNDENNLITLCIPCHVHTNINRRIWQLLFIRLINEKLNVQEKLK